MTHSLAWNFAILIESCAPKWMRSFKRIDRIPGKMLHKVRSFEPGLEP